MERAKIWGSITDVDGALAIAERRQHPVRGIATGIDVSGTGSVADAEAVEVMKSTPSTAPHGWAEAAEGASAMALREAAATSPKANLRNMVVLLKCEALPAWLKFSIF